MPGAGAVHHIKYRTPKNDFKESAVQYREFALAGGLQAKMLTANDARRIAVIVKVATGAAGARRRLMLFAGGTATGAEVGRFRRPRRAWTSHGRAFDVALPSSHALPQTNGVH
jgi:hypothetical protein